MKDSWKLKPLYTRLSSVFLKLQKETQKRRGNFRKGQPVRTHVCHCVFLWIPSFLNSGAHIYFIYFKESFQRNLENSRGWIFLFHVAHQKATGLVLQQNSVWLNSAPYFFPWKWEKNTLNPPGSSSRWGKKKKNLHVNLWEGHASLHDNGRSCVFIKGRLPLRGDKPWGLSDNVTKAPSTVERRDKHWDLRNPSEMSDFTLSD